MSHISNVNHRLSNAHTYVGAPLKVPGFYNATRRYFQRQAQEWVTTRFELDPKCVENRIRFKNKTVFVYTNTIYQTELWTFIDHSSGRWLTMRPKDIEATKLYLKAQAARAAQRQAEEAQAASAAQRQAEEA